MIGHKCSRKTCKNFFSIYSLRQRCAGIQRYKTSTIHKKNCRNSKVFIRDGFVALVTGQSLLFPRELQFYSQTSFMLIENIMWKRDGSNWLQIFHHFVMDTIYSIHAVVILKKVVNKPWPFLMVPLFWTVLCLWQLWHVFPYSAGCWHDLCSV